MQRRRHPNSAIFPDELMVEIISWLPVKHIMQLRCVNKFFKTIIFDSHFVQMHLNKSTRNSNMVLPWYYNFPNEDENYILHYTLVTLCIPYVFGIQIQTQIENKFTIFFTDPYYRLDDESISRRVVGSCNGLLCVISISSDDECWLCFWNPAMKTKSKEFSVSIHDCDLTEYSLSFGYDNSTQTYKVVAFYVEDKVSRNPKTKVKVFSFGDNSWRDLQCFPFIPLYWFSHKSYHYGVHLNGTINWLAHHDYYSVDDHYVILSLDLSTETYTQLLLPLGFDNDDEWPKIVLLADHLCFCHDFEETHFVIWQMKDFGVQDSWIQLFKISSQNHFESEYLVPFYLFENTLLLANERDLKSSIYSCIDNKVEKKTEIRDNIGWSYAMGYVESLVPTH